MEKKMIKLISQEDLKIFMSPQRLRLIRQMRIFGEPVTPKILADTLKISASSVQHHIKKLEKLGIVELDHTSVINGILAKYFRLADVDVSIGSYLGDDLSNERYAVMQNLMKESFDGLINFYESGLSEEEIAKNGEFLHGFINISHEDAQELFKIIREFIESHEKSDLDTHIWEYTLLMYNTGAAPMNDSR